MLKHLTMAALQAGLTGLGQSPLDNGTLEMIVCRPNFGQRRVIECGELDIVEGLIGDNWRARGSKATEDGRAHPEMQITLMNSRLIQLIAQERSRWALAGDQLFIDLDLSLENLPAGQRIAIGAAIIEVTAVPHTGCKKFAERFGQDAVRFVMSAEGRRLRRRGMNARVIRPGTIRAGDAVTKVAGAG